MTAKDSTLPSADQPRPRDLHPSEPRGVKAEDITFLMVGCQRCGSTWVDKALRGHPEIHLPPQKQTYFFDSNYDDGMDWYLEQYGPLKPGAKAVGEIATSYCLTDILPRVARELPDIKIIMSVRDPVDRALSHYKSRKEKYGWTSLEEALADDPDIVGGDNFRAKRAQKYEALSGTGHGWTTLKEALEDNPRIIERGQYPEQIETILQHFPKDRLLVLFYNDLVTDDRSYLRSILRFLEVDENWKSPALGQRIQVSAFARTRKLARKLGAGRLVDIVSASSLGDMIRRQLARNSKARNAKETTGTPVSHEAEILAPHFPFNLQQLEHHCNDGTSKPPQG
jgi:hypothetical protein